MTRRREITIVLAFIFTLFGLCVAFAFGICAVTGWGDKSAAEKHCDAIGWTWLHDGNHKGYCTSPEFVLPR